MRQNPMTNDQCLASIAESLASIADALAIIAVAHSSNESAEPSDEQPAAYLDSRRADPPA